MPRSTVDVGDASSTAPERLANHADMAASLAADLAAEHAALHEAIIDALSDRDDDGTPRWSHEQILDALRPLVGAQHRPPEPPRRPPHLKGQNTFTAAQAQEIRDHLGTLTYARNADDQQLAKAARGWLREIGFYLSDWTKPRHAFQRINFDQLVFHGLIEITDS